MKKADIIAIAEGLKLIEEGVETIQNVMRNNKIKSLQEIAAQLIPIFKDDDDSLSDSIVERLN